MERHARNLMSVFMVVVRQCDLQETGAWELRVLPRDGHPVSLRRTTDEVLNEVTLGIRGAAAKP